MYTQCVVIVYVLSTGYFFGTYSVSHHPSAVLILFNCYSIVSQKRMVMYAVIVSNLAGVSFIPIATMAEPEVSTYV